jgi:hypothetical protein
VRAAFAENGCGLVRGVEDEGVVEEWEGDKVEGAADEEGPMRPCLLSAP